jgi:hypothetical protein
MHEVFKAVFFDVLFVLCGEKSSPFSNLKDYQINQVDYGYHQGKKK